MMTDENQNQNEVPMIEKDKYLRLAADFENYRRGEAQRLDDWKLSALKGFLTDYLDVVDGWELAFRHTPDAIKDSELNEWYQGMEKQKSRMVDDLKKLGVSRIETVGKAFDPVTMEAVQMVQGGSSGNVSSEIRAGYMLHDRVIRPARVAVNQ